MIHCGERTGDVCVPPVATPAHGTAGTTAPRDEYGDVDVDNEQEELAAYDDTMAAQDEMNNWG